MARGENPGAVLTVEVVSTGNDALTYDKDQAFGHASAGKDLVLSMVSTGGNEGKAVIGADGSMILGKFVDLDQNGIASYMPAAHPMILRKSAADIVSGAGLVCAGGGKVKSPSTAGERDVARGFVTEVLENTDNGRILAWIP